MPIPPPTADEIIATLKNSELPSILVEGTSDASIYRWIENQVGTFSGNIIPCGGRSVVLEIYNRRNEIHNPYVIFLADRDMWLFTKVPVEYDSVIWTEGYSIENDLLAGTPFFLELFSSQEKMDFEKIVLSVSKWFSFQVEKFRENNEPLTCYNSQELLDERFALRNEFLEKINYVEPRAETLAEVHGNFLLKVRGKTMLAVLAHILSNPRRKSKYSKENIVELSLTITNGAPYITQIVSKIRYYLDFIKHSSQVAGASEG